jgi:hypothetical protein
MTFFERPGVLITLSGTGFTVVEIAKVANYLVYLEDVGWGRVQQPTKNPFNTTPIGVPEDTIGEGPIPNGESWRVVRDVFGNLYTGLAQCSGVFIVKTDGTYGPDYVAQACESPARGDASAADTGPYPFEVIGPKTRVGDETMFYGRVSPAVAAAHVIVDGVAAKDGVLVSSPDDLTPTQHFFAFVPYSATTVDIELVAADGHTMYRGTFDPKEAGG